MSDSNLDYGCVGWFTAGYDTTINITSQNDTISDIASKVIKLNWAILNKIFNKNYNYLNQNGCFFI